VTSRLTDEAHAGYMADPAVWRGRVFYASDLGIVRAVDALTGRQLWSHNKYFGETRSRFGRSNLNRDGRSARRRSDPAHVGEGGRRGFRMAATG